MNRNEWAVLTNVELTPSSRMLWLELSARCQASTMTVLEVGQEELCLAVGITPKTLRKALGQLADAHLLRVTRQHRKSLYEPLTPEAVAA